MSILIFNRLPDYDVPYDEWLKELNEDLYLMTNIDYCKDFTNYRQTYCFENYDHNHAVEFTALKLYQKNPYRRIVATAERDILRAARLREFLGLEGQSLDSALAFRDKMKMKSILKSAGIRVPAYARLNSAIDLYRFVRSRGYPVVVKPIDGMGSRNTTVLENDHDTLNFLAEGLDHNLEVEEFIEGEMYHIDGLILDGQIVLCWPSKYLNHCLAFQEGKYLGSYLLSPQNPLTPRLQAYVRSILGILPSPLNTTFHAEVFHTPDNELVLCEVACRTGGSRICEEYRQAFEIDLTKLSVQSQCGITVRLPDRVRDGLGPKSQYGFIGIPPKFGTFVSGPAAEELPHWVTEYRLLAKPGQVYDGAHTSVDYVVTLVVTGRSEQEVLDRIVEVADFFDERLEWN
ncbi:ATP-grasp domain-containing protein [Thermoactinomyces mirandus]|uniref:ATP-grasp domain-containing protein n=1 Tax=Thermoactinomyces mirandus TaxID=2756294 RepID=A0A7W1XQ29_9BACL|nr:ATP-grasp domain-containing protein [Thermoactinomyces mirandus]MBA4601212.1 ATP-grasp domain-containing protein [Thermoactinomyces mirandus]